MVGRSLASRFAKNEDAVNYSVSESVAINHSLSEVFTALEDPQTQIKYDGETYRSTEKLTLGPIGKRTRFRGDFKGMGQVEYEYSAFEKDRLIEHFVKTPAGIVHHRFEFIPEGNGTRLTQSIEAVPNLLGRLLWPIILKRQFQQRIQTLNTRVKRYAESQSRSAG